tara:strand:+ start:815 stop:1672 length:858 start_codon:yes stop_codon:yes gene_type:complete
MAYRGIQATNLISVDAAFDDALLILNKSGTTPVDVGFLGRIGPSSYSGLVKDSETDSFILINSINLSSQSINDISPLDTSIVKGNITVATITADSFVGNIKGNILNPTTGAMVVNASGGIYTLTGNVAGSLYGDVLSPTQNTPIITTGPVRDTLTIHDAHIEKIKAPASSGGATILNTSGATTLSGHNVHLTGSLYGDIGDTLANDPVLTVGTGNNDSQIAVTVASIDELQVNDSFVLPKGTAAQHPANPVEGQMFFNTETKLFEGYDGTSWIQFLPTTFSMATP